MNLIEVKQLWTLQSVMVFALGYTLDKCNLMGVAKMHETAVSNGFVQCHDDKFFYYKKDVM